MNQTKSVTNIKRHSEGPTIAPAQLINKAVLTRREAAAFLGVSERTLKGLNLPRVKHNHIVTWYLREELVQWVKEQPREGQLPSSCNVTRIRFAD